MYGRVETELFMVKKENFPPEMCWKNSVGSDNHLVGGYSEEDIQKLEVVEGEDMSCLKSATLE